VLSDDSAFGKLPTSRTLFLTATSPEALLALIGLISRESAGWRNNLMRAIEIEGMRGPKRGEHEVERQNLLKFIQRALSRLAVEVEPPA